MTNVMIQTLRNEFAKIEAIDPSSAAYKNLVALLDRCDDEAILAAKNAGIKFVSSLALNRCIRRGLV